MNGNVTDRRVSARAGTGHLEGAPAEYVTPSVRPTLAEAQAWCRRLVKSHYENFHVATWFLPKRVRPHFESIYAFSRVADDLGDEVPDRAVATRLLSEWRTMLDECYEQSSSSKHPVFVALHKTIFETGVPRYLFADLIRAFQMDQTVTQYESIGQLIGYSRDSANPVGRLVLWVCGYRDEERATLSDKICTALQLANFWQDVAEDWERGRRYLPAEEMHRFGVTDAMIREHRFTPEFAEMMKYLVSLTGVMLAEGGQIKRLVDRELAVTLRLFEQGGRAALDGIITQRYDVLSKRPSVSKAVKARIMFGALTGKLESLLPGSGKTRT